MFSNKVQGGALSLVLTIGIVITSLTGAMLLAFYYRNLTLARHGLVERLERNAASGIAYVLANKTTALAADLDLYGKGEDSVQVANQQWGLYDLALARAHGGRLQASKAALLGGQADSFGELALYLADEDRPLYVAEGASVEGACMLPQAGIKQVQLGQQTGTPGAHAVKGKVSQSSALLPKRFQQVLQRAREVQQLKGQEPIHITPLADGQMQGHTGHHSFWGETAVFTSQQHLRVDHTTLSGKVLVTSNRGITLGRNARLNDVIVLAPYIVLEEGFAGSLQLIARDSVIIRKGCRLSYPSAVSVVNDLGQGYVKIEEGSKVTGEVSIGGESTAGSFHRLAIQKGAMLSGIVYVDGAVEHSGTVLGSLLCRRLMHRTPTALYENYLVDGTISAKDLSTFFLPSPGMSSGGKTAIIKWLN